MKFDFVGFAAGAKTAGALLVGNSVLVYTGVLGSTLVNSDMTALKIFIIGLAGLVLTSITRGSK
jgi:hypothetical protein